MTMPSSSAATTSPTVGPVQAGGGSNRDPGRSTIAPRAPATTISPPVPPAVISRRTTGIPISGGSMSMPANAIIFGIEPRLAIPMPSHAVQSMAIPRVSGRVVRNDDMLLQSKSLAAL